MADNESVIPDQDGEFDDWIELFNISGYDIDLDGYYLSDDFANPCRWVFPDTILAGGGYIIVWADEDEEQTGLHANFKLSAGGETVVLSDPAGAIVDGIEFEPTMSNTSLGRYPNGSGNFRIMVPTPGFVNMPEYPEALADSSALLFNDSIVYTYNIDFYYDNWEDSLIYYFEVNDEAYIPALITFNDSLVLDSVGVRYKGNSSYTLSGSSPKKPFKFKFDHFKTGQTLYGVERLNFSNGLKDPAYMREKIGYYIARQYMPAPRTAYCNLYIDGELIGFYVQVEQIDKDFLGRYFDNNDGNLFKAGNYGATMEYKGPEQADYEGDYELKTNEYLNDWSKLIEFIDKLNNTPSEEFVSVIGNYIDIDNCLRLLAFNMALSNFDSYTGSGRNYYLYDNPTTGKFNIIPWDMNESFGVYTNNWNVFTQSITTASNMTQRPLIERMLENDSLRIVYMYYIAEMKDSFASCDSISAYIEETTPLIDPYIQTDPNKFYSYQNFLDNIENNVSVGMGILIPGLKSFIQTRSDNLSLQLQTVRVYPGDTDNNGVVDEYDILPIGVYFLQEGNSRSGGSFSWSGQDVMRWDDEAVSYADANGDGIVDEADVIGIAVNWGNTHYSSAAPGGGYFDNDVLEQHREDFLRLYNSLTGFSEPVIAIRNLLSTALLGDEALPVQFKLYQNYPNPFNASMIIKFDLPEAQTVIFTIYNLLGEKVKTPINGLHFTAGSHSVDVDASGLASGVYLYRLKTEKWDSMKKMALIK